LALVALLEKNNNNVNIGTNPFAYKKVTNQFRSESESPEL